jgi:hypothetical protein
MSLQFPKFTMYCIPLPTIYTIFTQPLQKCKSGVLSMKRGEPQRNDTDEKPKNLGKKPVPVPFCPPKITHGMSWVQTQVSVAHTVALLVGK